ncbi:MAG: hypothetical protein K2M05_07060 [Paramuribaculum sp.]|nr:hypothetical protein [Paramuribaculum sp.]MDE6304896.1 hypothetical protein [Paramuribaculum sp.]
MNKLILALPILLFLLLVNACKNGSQASPETQEIVCEPVEIVRLDSIMAMPGYAATTDSANAPAVAALIEAVGAADENEYISSRAFMIFGQDTRTGLTDLSNVEKSLGVVKNHLDSFPDKVYGVVWPFRQTVMVGDSLVMVALNHYLGPDYEGYSGLPIYQKALKTPDRIVYDVAEAWVSSRFPYKNDMGVKVSNRMFYEGALLLRIKEATGVENEWELLGMTPEEWQTAKSAEADVWRELAARQLLFSDSPEVEMKLFDPAPSTVLGNMVLPGRIGRFMGIRMVESYLASHPGETPQSILDSEVYNDRDVMRLSGYSPQ